MSPYFRKTVSEDVSGREFREGMKQVAREYCAIRHDRKFPDPSCTPYPLRQRAPVKTGCVHLVDLDIRIGLSDFLKCIMKLHVADSLLRPAVPLNQHVHMNDVVAPHTDPFDKMHNMLYVG